MSVPRDHEVATGRDGDVPPSLLRLGVLHVQRDGSTVVAECRGRITKADAMLDEIGGRLPAIPLERQTSVLEDLHAAPVPTRSITGGGAMVRTRTLLALTCRTLAL